MEENETLVPSFSLESIAGTKNVNRQMHLHFFNVKISCA